MDPTSADWMNSAVDLGTTIMAVQYNGGVVMGADSRVTTGTYVSNRASDKIQPLTDNVYLCRSGSAADTQTITDYVRYFLHQHVIKKDGPAEVKTAANLCMQLAYNNKKMLSAGLIIGGWDKRDGASVYAIPIGGTMLKVPFTIGGSGSSYIYGYCDQAYKDGMTKEEAMEFVVKAVTLALGRDGSSGGYVRLAIISEDGVERKNYLHNELPLFYGDMKPVDSLIPPGGSGMSQGGAEPMAAS
eukprot:TRINITY_DN7297_c0_g1_i1.p1 TRINITY_DN7297_c0_g1~~TRINITY_DN7297_c0_g1_i1.p1  ORF type:complete len:264 (-),score=39.60 TRINITY_DN7297_c0_g1_i1:580-1308(-)